MLASRLAALPNPAALAADRDIWDRRRTALETLNRLRQGGAHDKEQEPPTPADIERAWRDTVEEEVIAFYRYFPAALLRHPETS